MKEGTTKMMMVMLKKPNQVGSPPSVKGGRCSTTMTHQQLPPRSVLAVFQKATLLAVSRHFPPTPLNLCAFRLQPQRGLASTALTDGTLFSADLFWNQSSLLGRQRAKEGTTTRPIRQCAGISLATSKVEKNRRSFVSSSTPTLFHVCTSLARTRTAAVCVHEAIKVDRRLAYPLSCSSFGLLFNVPSSSSFLALVS